MEPDKLIEVFEDLLNKYKSAEISSISQGSVCITDDYKELEEELRNYRKRFYEALGEK